MVGKHKKSDREKRQEKALKHLAALIIHHRERIAIHEQLLAIIQEALKPEPAPPISAKRWKELRKIYDQAHPQSREGN